MMKSFSIESSLNKSCSDALVHEVESLVSTARSISETEHNNETVQNNDTEHNNETQQKRNKKQTKKVSSIHYPAKLPTLEPRLEEQLVKGMSMARC